MPAVGINMGNPYFYRCKIHDGKYSAIEIYKGKGVFKECSIFSFEKDAPAIQVLDDSYPRFEECTIQNCKGGGFLFTDYSRGLIEKCELFGFIFHPAVLIVNEAKPQFFHCKIHDGNGEGVVCASAGKGMLESCEIYGFNSHIISVSSAGQLDVLRSKIYKGNAHGLRFTQKSQGIVQDCQIYQFSKSAAIHVSQMADPFVSGCQIYDSFQGVQVTEDGRGKFEQCIFWDLKEGPWDIQEGEPEINQCKDEDRDELNPMTEDESEFVMDHPKINQLFTELNQEIGQPQVKEKMKEVILYFDYLQDRKRLGLKTMDQIYVHSLFFGPPDTGKERMAELYGKMLKEMELISKDHLVMIKAKEYLDQDPEQIIDLIQQKMKEAIGGVLYFEDVHQLSVQATNDPFIEVLKQLLQQEGTAVILAGPEPALRKWLQPFPNIEKMFTNQYYFEEYSPEEMVEIFFRIAKQEEYRVHPTCKPVLLRAMRHLWSKIGETSCVERIKEYFHQVLYVQSRRCAKIPKQERTKEVLTTIMPEDLPMRTKKEIFPGDTEWLTELERYKLD
jgi:Right handed beta helix region/ATPase family associated with various cellular activities (AAA)